LTGFGAGIGLAIVPDPISPKRRGVAPLDEPGPGRRPAPAARKVCHPADAGKRATR
jgi:hypothetical protein